MISQEKTKKQTKKLSKFILHFKAIDAAQWTISYNYNCLIKLLLDV